LHVTSYSRYRCSKERSKSRAFINTSPVLSRFWPVLVIALGGLIVWRSLDR
jgi:hypothetical protein